MTDWPHAPVHRLGEAGAYMVTAGTYGKRPFFDTVERLDPLRDSLISLAGQYGWRLQAWAVLPNHYHFVALSPGDASTLRALVRHLNSVTAIAVNRLDNTPGRKVWFEYWDTHLTYEKSYLARLKYVHLNPVRHGLAAVAEQYPWCSAGWFERMADRVFVKTVQSFKIDRVNVQDDFDPMECGSLLPL